MIVTSLLPIFFLYFILLSGYCSELLNCSLQKYMDNNIFFRHLLIFLSIYIFTFVLNWYTFESLQIQHVSRNKNDEESNKTEKDIITKEVNFKKLLNWFIQSSFIYLIFLITTKSEVKQFLLFFIIVLICIILQLILKSISSEEYSELNNKIYLKNDDYNGSNKSNVILLHNTTSIGYLFSFIIIFHGFYKYYNRQRKDHKKNWNNLKFIFGTTTKSGKECSNLK